MKLFYIVWGLWFFLEIFLYRMTKSKKVQKSKDKESLNIIWVAIIFGISLGIIIMFNTNLPFSKNLSVPYIGLLTIIIGVLFRFSVIVSLKKEFSVDVTIKENHKLKTTGFYKFVRHPAYTGSIISFIGMGLSFNNIFSFFVITIPVVYAFLYRIKVEEKVLIENFGEEYLEYMKKTKRLIPFLF